MASIANEFEERALTIVRADEAEVILAALEVELTYTSFTKAKTYKIAPCGDGKWSLSHVEGWAPANDMSCIGKVSAIIDNVGKLMVECPDDTIFLQIKGDMGAQVMGYHMEHS